MESPKCLMYDASLGSQKTMNWGDVFLYKVLVTITEIIFTAFTYF